VRKCLSKAYIHTFSRFFLNATCFGPVNVDHEILIKVILAFLKGFAAKRQYPDLKLDIFIYCTKRPFYWL